MWRDGEKGAYVNIEKREGESEKEASREVVGGSGPYREAGTTLASAILSARDIHNHLVLLALSRGARVLLFVVPFSTSLPRRATARRGKRKRGSERRGGTPEKDLSRDFGPLLSSLGFGLPRLPITSPGFGSLTIGNFRNFAGPFKTQTAGKRSSVCTYTSRSSLGARNKSRARLRFLPRASSLRPAELLSISRASSV